MIVALVGLFDWFNDAIETKIRAASNVEQIQRMELHRWSPWSNSKWCDSIDNVMSNVMSSFSEYYEFRSLLIGSYLFILTETVFKWSLDNFYLGKWLEMTYFGLKLTCAAARSVLLLWCLHCECAQQHVGFSELATILCNKCGCQWCISPRLISVNKNVY